MSGDNEQFSRIKQFYDEEYYGTSAKNHELPWHYRLVADRLGSLKGARVLDVACGVGDWLALVQSRGAEISGIDISERAIDRCRQRFPHREFHLGPAESLPFPDAAFDVVTCLGSLEHFVQPEKALREMLRVATPDAAILLLVPNAGFLPRRLGLYGGTHQVKVREVVRSLDEWRELFRGAGLSVDKRWRDLHVLSWSWINLGGWRGWVPRALQALLLPVWPLDWQYQVYHLCHRAAGPT